MAYVCQALNPQDMVDNVLASHIGLPYLVLAESRGPNILVGRNRGCRRNKGRIDGKEPEKGQIRGPKFLTGDAKELKLFESR